ncbi:HAMP domain-containing protein [Actinomadura darangshiensis]|uniref:histidine kinase n=1 Tax=Actinomadura darangshiensis TaxID=705336 RepID=A0A4R5BGP7_9ACTN|nr:nitrate- and nitrite sensing domain-containing protein [Actinomadura darangshiensis]TDD85591.1 HAMP domain-containing protein [Actinomadura darangshiensis]
MRPRRRSIRFSLYGQLIIPMISLVTLWFFAAQSTASDAIHQRNIDTANKIYGNAVQPMLVTLAQERQESVVWLSGGGRLPRTSMDALRQKMDGTIVQMNSAARSDKFQGTLTGPMKQRLSTLIAKLNGIGALRGQVDSGSMSKLAAFNAYNDIIDTHFGFIYLLVADNGDQQAYHLTGMSRAIELAGREAALVGGVIVAGGRMTSAEHTAVTKVVFERRYLETSSISEFTRANGAPFKEALASDAADNFTAVEDGILATRPGARLHLTPTAWQGDVGGFIKELDGGLGKSRVVLAGDAKKTSDATLLRLALIGVIGLVAVALTAFLMLRFGRRISRDLLGLQGAARDLADQRLPSVVSRLRRGDEVDVATEAPPLAVGRTAEVSNVAAAFSSVQRTAVEAAVGQAELRMAVNGVFQNLARRNQSLLHRQLSMLDTLESKASDPEALADLFAIDHLTTRMRRHAEGLIILSGAAPGRGWRHPVGILDVLRGAIGEIEDYARAEVVSTAEEGIIGSAVADVIHLLAELIENAAAMSPPNTPVEVDAGLVGQGFVVEIQDRGLGMGPVKLAAVNEQLGREPEFDLSNGDQLGLFVVGSLAYRHGIKVVLEQNSYGGIKTIVLLPHSIVVPADRIGRADEPESANAPADTAPAAGSEPPDTIGGDVQKHAVDSVGRHRGGTEPLAVHEVTGTRPPPEPPVAHLPSAAAASTTGGTHAGMPRRVRRANLAPQLRDAAPQPPSEGAPSEGRNARSPERARSVMASMQSGWRRGRAEPLTPTPPAGWNDGRGER